jgi:hypothetical protein
VDQPFGAESARVKGRRKMMRPAARRKAPGTVVTLVMYFYSFVEILTIKFAKVEYNTL